MNGVGAAQCVALPGQLGWVCEQLLYWSWCRDNGSSCFSWQLRQLAAGQALGCCLSSSNNLTTATSAIRSRLGTMEPGLATSLGQHNPGNNGNLGFYLKFSNISARVNIGRQFHMNTAVEVTIMNIKFHTMYKLINFIS